MYRLITRRCTYYSCNYCGIYFTVDIVEGDERFKYHDISCPICRSSIHVWKKGECELRFEKIN